MRSYLLLHFSFLKPVFYTPFISHSSYPSPVLYLSISRFAYFIFICIIIHSVSFLSYSFFLFIILFIFSLTMYIYRVTIV